MTWDPVAWFIGGGALHSPEVARLLAYAATNGAEGIVSPGDLKVSPLAVPGSSIRVLIGAALILNRAAGGAQQTYVGRNVSEDVKAIPSTGPGSGRNDLIIAQIKDPFLPGEPWADPADVTVGPYIFTEIVSNVPLSATVDTAAAAAYLRTQGITGIPLAALVIPANTATITSTLIKDLRALALPRSLSRNYGGPPTATTTLTPSGSFVSLPQTPNVEIPAWATHWDIVASANVQAIAGSAGAIRTAVGTTPIGGQIVNWSGGAELNVLTAADLSRSIPVDLRGTSPSLALQVRVDSGQLSVIGWAMITFQVSFYERAV